jgi:lysophospholipase L1-like esterase
VSRTLANLALLLVSTLFCVAVAECGLRIARYGSIAGLSGEHSLRVPHPLRGWTLQPGGSAYQRTRDYGVLVRINSQGLRDREHAYERAAGTFRVVVLGDSFMEAYQVEVEESLPYRLQDRLAHRGVEVINLGVGGYGTVQEHLYLRDEGLRYAPDLVVLAFYGGNDLVNNSRALQELLVGGDDLKTFGRPYARAERFDVEPEWVPPDAERLRAYAERWRSRRTDSWRRALRFLQPSMLAHAVEQASASITRRVTGRRVYDPNVLYGWPFLERFEPRHAGPDLDEERYARVWEETWRVTRATLLASHRLARAHGAELAVMTVPALFQADADERARIEAYYPGLRLDPERLHRELARFCAAQGIAFVDLLPAFRREEARAGVTLYHRIEDQHWNAAGHALAAQELERALDQRGLLPAAGLAGG